MLLVLGQGDQLVMMGGFSFTRVLRSCRVCVVACSTTSVEALVRLTVPHEG